MIDQPARMPRHAVALMLTLTLLSAAAEIRAGSNPQSPTVHDTKVISAYVERTRRNWELPGIAIAVVKDGREVMVAGFGVRTLDSPEPIDADTVFSIASLTKAFTATAAAAAVDRGEITWDAPVARFLPGFQLYDPYVTAAASFRDLLSNRVGTRENYVNGMALSRAAMIARVAGDQPVAPFRSSFVYHNLLYAAAGEAVANAAGRSWDEDIRRTLFEPLQMSASSTTARALASAQNVAASHVRRRDHTLQVDPFRPGGWWSMDNHAPAGAINSTARDMAKWLEFQVGDGTFRGRRVLSRRALTETHLIQIPIHEQSNDPVRSIGYGMGWRIGRYGSEEVLMHTGSFRGHSAEIIMVPARRIGVFVFVNERRSTIGSVKHAIALWVIDRYLGNPLRDWASESRREYLRDVAERSARFEKMVARPADARPPRKNLREYVGSYGNERLGIYDVSVESDTLRLDARGMSEPYHAVLSAWNADTFQPSWNELVVDYEPAQLVAFTFDPYGNARSLLLYPESGPPIELLRRQ